MMGLKILLRAHETMKILLRFNLIEEKECDNNISLDLLSIIFSFSRVFHLFDIITHSYQKVLTVTENYHNRGKGKNILKTKTSPTRSVVHFFVEQYKTKTIQYNVHRYSSSDVMKIKMKL